MLTAPEIAVNPLTWSLGFPPDEVRDVSPHALLQALSCCPLCSFPQAAGKAAFPGATALTSSSPRGNYSGDGRAGERL